VERTADRRAADVAAALHRASDAFGSGAGPTDDRTVLVMRGLA